MLADLAGWLNVVTVIAPIVVFMVGAGMASPFALTGAVSVNPHAIGAASGLYGFTQMAYGALCTVIVEVWRPGSVFPVAAVLLASALLGQGITAVWRASMTSQASINADVHPRRSGSCSWPGIGSQRRCAGSATGPLSGFVKTYPRLRSWTALPE
jgi:hypothetical protein